MQEVNLLSDDLIPRKEPFTLREFGLAWALLASLLGAMTFWQIHSSGLAENETNEKQLRLAAIKAEISQLEKQAEQRADTALTEELAHLTKQRDDYRKLVGALNNQTLSTGFHNHLYDLAATHMRKLWFDTIEITRGGEHIRLAGFSEAAELVPLYLSMLSQGDAFSGYNFDGMEIERQTDVLVSFEIRGPAIGEDP